MAIIYQEYEKLRFLGKGAFAQIYKVRHKDLGYVRAIKVLTEEVNEGEDDKIYKTFEKECTLLLKLGNGGHPNIIRIYRPRNIDGRALVEMDYIDGVTLESYVSENKFLPIDEVYRFIKEIGSALAYCHVDCYRYMMRPEEKDRSVNDLIQTYGVAHNDIHSNNIMKKNLDGSYVLLDFGLAIQDDKAVKSSSRGDGAAEYIPPEKWAGEAIANEKAVDIYGFGILIYQMLTGQVPFVLDPNEYKKDSLKTLNTIRHRHETERPADILQLRRAAYENSKGKDDYNRDYPEWLDELVYKCLEKNPEDRFHDAKELQKFFCEHLNEDTSSAENTIKTLQEEVYNLRQKVLTLVGTAQTDSNVTEESEELFKAKEALAETQIKLKKATEDYSVYYKLSVDQKEEIEGLKKEIDKKKRPFTWLAVVTSILVVLLSFGGFKYYKDIDSLKSHTYMGNPVTPMTTEDKIDISNTEETELKDEVTRLQTLVKEKDDKIRQCNVQISSLQSDINQKEKQIITLQASDQSETVKSMQQTVNNLRKQVQTLTAERDRYKEQVKNLINNTL